MWRLFQEIWALYQLLRKLFIRKILETTALVTVLSHLFCKKEIPKPEMIKNIDSKSPPYNSFNLTNASGTPTASEGNK